MGEEIKTQELWFYTIYGPNQGEYPGQYVVRLWGISENIIKTPDEPEGLGGTLGEARTFIGASWARVCLPRHENDDPSIVETWI